MSAIVLGGGYVSSNGRKPSRPGFYYAMHNDAAGGSTIADRWANGPTLTLDGTLGTAWSANRGYITPNGISHQARAASGGGYCSQDVAGAVLTPGQAIVLGWLVKWPSAKSSSTECMFAFGRNNTNAGALLIGHGATQGYIELQQRGPGASASAFNSFGAGASYTTNTEHQCTVHIAGIEGGMEAVAWLNGVQIGTMRTMLWSANGGSAPALSAWAQPDAITLLASRTGTDPNSPTWSTRVGAGNSAGTLVADMWCINIGAANVALAGQLALEAHQYRRQIGPTMGAL